MKKEKKQLVQLTTQILKAWPRDKYHTLIFFRNTSHFVTQSIKRAELKGCNLINLVLDTFIKDILKDNCPFAAVKTTIASGTWSHHHNSPGSICNFTTSALPHQCKRHRSEKHNYEHIFVVQTS
jgi:hypothetical protein